MYFFTSNCYFFNAATHSIHSRNNNIWGKKINILMLYYKGFFESVRLVESCSNFYSYFKNPKVQLFTIAMQFYFLNTFLCVKHAWSVQALITTKFCHGSLVQFFCISFLYFQFLVPVPLETKHPQSDHVLIEIKILGDHFRQQFFTGDPLNLMFYTQHSTRLPNVGFAAPLKVSRKMYWTNENSANLNNFPIKILPASTDCDSNQANLESKFYLFKSLAKMLSKKTKLRVSDGNLFGIARVWCQRKPRNRCQKAQKILY